MSKLLIALDPGFDSMKVVANGKIFKFPFNVVETDERKMNDYNLRDDFLLYKDEAGITSRVGQYARELVFERKSKEESEALMESFYTEQRFTSGEFKVALRTAIGKAINENKLPCTDPGEIYLMVALPHACRSRFAPSIIGAAAGEHHFSLRCGVSEEKTYAFSISEKNIFTVSQTIAAILGETSDAKGNINEKKFFYLSNGPTLVLDGGYYTMGIVELSKGGSVDDDKTESDTLHAMRNINMAVAQEIQAQRPDVKHYIIEYLMSQNDGRIRYMDHGRAAVMDLVKIRKSKMKETCNDFIRYLNKKYNNLLDINYMLVTGGTGANFFPFMKNYYEKTGVMDETHMLLSSSELLGNTFSIEFSIAIGAYKGLRGKIAK